MHDVTSQPDRGQGQLREWHQALREAVTRPFAKREWDAGAAPLTPRAVLAGFRWYVLISLALGILCAFLGPFGTYSDAPLARLVYWVSIFIVNGAQVLGALALVVWLTGGRRPIAILSAAAAVLASLPATAEVFALEYLLRGHVPDNLLDVFVKVLLLTLAVSISIGLVRARLATQAAGAIVPPTPGGPTGEALLKRIKPELRGELLALQMEDHYLRVHTSGGNDLILYRLSDALTEVAGLEGRQVHRSYWVARTAIAAAERDGRRLVLVLKNGLKVPVSRANVTAIKSAGWV
jgi:hypothetical protein